MLKTLETDRLILRERLFEDFQACLELDRTAEVVDYIPVLKKIINDQLAHEAFMKKRFETVFPQGMGYWTVMTKDTPQAFAGWVMLTPIDDEETDIEIGWRLRPKFWGKGYATEAAGALLRYAVEELELKRIIAEIHPDNIGSIKVAEKIGMKPLKKTENMLTYVCP